MIGMSHKVFPKEEYLLKGHAACPGCGATILLRHVLKALGPETYMVIPASCSSVIAGPYPKTSFAVPLLHIAFAASAAAASGMVEALEKLGREGVNVVVWAGDGGTVDIGLQALSGAAERGHNIIYICYDNEAYMNTGIQKSGSTPPKAWTTTTPTGNPGFKKDMPSIMAAHRVPYVATLNPAYPNDIARKLRKAASIRGLKYLHALSPCPPGWRYDTSLTVRVARLAVETGIWVLYEVERGVFRLTGPSRMLLDPSKRKPVKEYLRLQGRFRHLSDSDVEDIQRMVDENWEKIAQLVEDGE